MASKLAKTVAGQALTKDGLYGGKARDFYHEASENKQEACNNVTSGPTVIVFSN
jgi:hypothetical protein